MENVKKVAQLRNRIKQYEAQKTSYKDNPEALEIIQDCIDDWMGQLLAITGRTK